jgi:hypothetical protein
LVLIKIFLLTCCYQNSWIVQFLLKFCKKVRKLALLRNIAIANIYCFHKQEILTQFSVLVNPCFFVSYPFKNSNFGTENVKEISSALRQQYRNSTFYGRKLIIIFVAAVSKYSNI